MYKIAFWVVFPDSSVLLKQQSFQNFQRIQKREKPIIHWGPLTKWTAPTKEAIKKAIEELIKENFDFVDEVKINVKEIEKEIFAQGVCYHLLTSLPFTVDIKNSNIILINFQDLPKVSPIRGKGEIKMFKKNYEVLRKILQSESNLSLFIF